MSTFFTGVGPCLRWFNSELHDYMDLYVDSGSGAYILVEKYNCDIIATSRIYEGIGTTKLLPPNAWDHSTVKWNVHSDSRKYQTNACSLYTFNTFQDFVAYIKVLYATKDSIPFFQLQQQLQEERLARLVDADSEPPPKMKYYIKKIYIS